MSGSVVLMERASAHGAKVLVMDAHLPSLAVLCHVLTKQGFACRGVTNIAAALENARSFMPDAFIYEWMYGPRTETGLAHAIRAIVAPEPIVVIALSTQDEPNDFREREGVDAYILKPYLAEAILAELSRAGGSKRR